MNDPIYTEKWHGLTINIYQDQDPHAPNEWGDDNKLFLLGYHRDFWVEGPKVFYKLQPGQVRDPKDKGHLLVTKNELIRYFDPEEVCPECEADGLEKGKDNVYCPSCDTISKEAKLLRPSIFDGYHVFGLEAYIHGGVRLALLNEGNFCDRSWDVSNVGAVLVAKEEWPGPAEARKTALGLIEDWNDYLSGNVYGYAIMDQAGEEISSCWGYYGDYEDKNNYGALDEARAEVDSMTNKGLTDHNGQMLFSFMGETNV